MLSSLLRVSDWAGLEWGLRVYGSNIFPEDAQSVGPGTHTGKPLLKEPLRRAWSLPILAVTSEKEISKRNGLNSKFFATMIISLSLLTCLLYLLLKINLTLCIDPQSGRGVSQGRKISLLSSFLWPPRLFSSYRNHWLCIRCWGYRAGVLIFRWWRTAPPSLHAAALWKST